MKEFDQRNFFVLFAISVVLAFFAVGSAPLLEPFETVYKDVADTMLNTGNFWVVQNDGQKIFSYPPFYFWTLALINNFDFFPEYFVRLPSALCVALTGFFLYPYGTKIFDERAGFWSCLILSTFGLSILTSKLTFNISMFVFALTMFSLCYLHKQYWLMYFFIALGVASVGLAGAVFPLVLLFFHCLVIGRLKRLFSIHLILGMLTVCLVFSPWFFVLYQAYGKEFINGFCTFMALTPFVQSYAQNQSFSYYLPVLFISLMPWTGFVPGAVYSSFGESKNADLENLLFMYVWLILGFVFLIIYPWHFVTMLWLIMPPLAIILGWNLYRIEKEISDNSKYDGYVLGSVVTFVVEIGIWFTLTKLTPDLVFSGYVMVFLTVVLLICILITVVYFRDIHLFAMLHVGGGVLNMVFFSIYFLPVIVEQINLKTFILDLLK